VRELVYCRLFATCSGFCVPGKDEGELHCRSDTPKTDLGAHTASCTTGTVSFPGVKSGWGVTLTPQPFLVPWSRKSTAIPLLPLWTVRPAQSLSACTVQLYIYSPQCQYSTAIPLLPLWAVRPVQSLSACTVQLYLYFPYGPYSLYSTAIPLLPLWTVQTVQSLSACTVQLYLYFPYGPYGLYRASVPVQYR